MNIFDQHCSVFHVYISAETLKVDGECFDLLATEDVERYTGYTRRL